MRTVSLIIARQNKLGKRLPNKVLEKIGDKTILQHVYESTEKLGKDIIICTGHYRENADLIVECSKLGYKWFSGPENDVLKRVTMCAVFHEADYVLRVNADCPFFEKEKSMRLFEFCMGTHDYITYYYQGKPMVAQYPYGEFKELISVNALVRANLASGTQDREHVTPFIYNHERLFDIKKIDTGLPINRMPDINTYEDLKRVRQWYKKNTLDRL